MIKQIKFLWLLFLIVNARYVTLIEYFDKNMQKAAKLGFELSVVERICQEVLWMTELPYIKDMEFGAPYDTIDAFKGYMDRTEQDLMLSNQGKRAEIRRIRKAFDQLSEKIVEASDMTTAVASVPPDFIAFFDATIQWLKGFGFGAEYIPIVRIKIMRINQSPDIGNMQLGENDTFESVMDHIFNTADQLAVDYTEKMDYINIIISDFQRLYIRISRAKNEPKASITLEEEKQGAQPPVDSAGVDLAYNFAKESSENMRQYFDRIAEKLKSDNFSSDAREKLIEAIQAIRGSPDIGRIEFGGDGTYKGFLDHIYAAIPGLETGDTQRTAHVKWTIGTFHLAGGKIQEAKDLVSPSQDARPSSASDVPSNLIKYFDRTVQKLKGNDFAPDAVERACQKVIDIKKGPRAQRIKCARETNKAKDFKQYIFEVQGQLMRDYGAQRNEIDKVIEAFASVYDKLNQDLYKEIDKDIPHGVVQVFEALADNSRSSVENFLDECTVKKMTIFLESIEVLGSIQNYMIRRKVRSKPRTAKTRIYNEDLRSRFRSFEDSVSQRPGLSRAMRQIIDYYNIDYNIAAQSPRQALRQDSLFLHGIWREIE